ncbi:hypothetical protein RND71_040702 [Anisodus tanguticus]|uniref:Uncharacterized protein n=1 Tax=Anisodus tanguticus TaxID=243964 RepID=A0AAE1QTF9_9SOLA|nr:hypothetical protein RND71_040702 [Anisodus tanguticus]
MEAEIYSDIRRNSLDEPIKLCLEGGLQGIVSEVKAILRNPRMIAKIKESNLSLLAFGQLNNEKEVVYLQYMMEIQGQTETGNDLQVTCLANTQDEPQTEEESEFR